MADVVFTVRSDSTGEVYRLEAARTDRGVRFTCTCQAGQNGIHCKHRVALLLGDVSAAVDIDEGAVERLKALAHGSPLLDAVAEVARVEAVVAKVQQELKGAKRALARAMAG